MSKPFTVTILTQYGVHTVECSVEVMEAVVQAVGAESLADGVPDDVSLSLIDVQDAFQDALNVWVWADGDLDTDDRSFYDDDGDWIPDDDNPAFTVPKAVDNG